MKMKLSRQPACNLLLFFIFYLILCHISPCRSSSSSLSDNNSNNDYDGTCAGNLVATGEDQSCNSNINGVGDNKENPEDKSDEVGVNDTEEEDEEEENDNSGVSISNDSDTESDSESETKTKTIEIELTDDLMHQIHVALEASGVSSEDKARIQEIAMEEVHKWHTEIEAEEENRAERDLLLQQQRQKKPPTTPEEEDTTDFPYDLMDPPPPISGISRINGEDVKIDDYALSLDEIVQNWEPEGGRRFEEYTSGYAPYKITSSLMLKSDRVARKRRPYILAAMQHAWDGYRQYAFGDDEVRPQTKRGTNHWGGIGVTLVDSLDTLWLLGMKDEFQEARDYVRDDLSHDQDRKVSVFETTIRSLGGLLSAYDWSRDEVFLEEAMDLARRLMRAFDHPVTGRSTVLPYGEINLKDGSCNMIPWAGGNAILSEFGTLQIEFRYLDEIMRTAETKEFRHKVEHIFELLEGMNPENGLYPYYFKTTAAAKSTTKTTGQRGAGATATMESESETTTTTTRQHVPPKPVFTNDHLTFGAMADSFYEYMLKIWLQGGKQEPMYRTMYDKAIQGLHDELLHISKPSGLTYLADRVGGGAGKQSASSSSSTSSTKKRKRTQHKMDHLCCFVGGMLALGAYTDPLGLESDRAQRDLQTARALTYTCYQMYARMKTGISPEYVEFSAGKDFKVGKVGPHYLLRPETVESFYILNVLTGDPIYREWGWEIFLAIEKYCKTHIAYGSLKNVQDNSSKPRDDMESFFLAETLKYLYLLNDPESEIDILNKHVFNTEAHPMRIFPLIEEELKNESRQQSS